MKYASTFLRISAIATVILLVLVVYSYHVTTSENVQRINVGNSTFFTDSPKALVQIIDGFQISNLSGTESTYLKIQVNLSITQIVSANFEKSVFDLVNYTMYHGSIYSQTVILGPGFYRTNMSLRIYVNFTYASSLVGNSSAVVISEGNSFGYAVFGLMGSGSLMALAIYLNYRRK